MATASASQRQLPLPPRPLRKASFADLARFFGLGTALSDADIEKQHDSAEEDDDQDGSADGIDSQDHDVDEETLMWDAQAALIAHQPSLAIKRYTTAALPPHCSPTACLALGNLLTRGTGFTTTTTSPADDQSPIPVTRKGKEKAVGIVLDPSIPSPLQTPLASPPAFTRFLHTFFGTAPPTSPPETSNPLTTSNTVERRYDLVGNGWAMRKEGKRAVRDVEEMGIAGGWLVLGLGWIVDSNMSTTIRNTTVKSATVRTPRRVAEAPAVEPLEDDVVVMGSSRAKHKDGQASLHEQTHTPEHKESHSASTSTASSTRDNSSTTHSSTTQTVDTIDSVIIETPGSGVAVPNRDFAGEAKILRLIYDLLQPLLHLYRHGHIQASDPVYLPPITPKQLPSVLRPIGDLEKRRNAWALGAVVAGKLLNIEPLQISIGLEHAVSKERVIRDWCQLACGVRNLANYILGMTSEKHLREGYFRAILNVGPCGLTLADDIVRQAGKRLDIINTPSEPNTPNLQQDGYPFPQMSTLKPPSRGSATSRRKRIESVGTRRKTSLSNVCNPSAPRRTVSGVSLRSINSPSLSPVKLSNVTIAPEDSPRSGKSAMYSLQQVSEKSSRHKRVGSAASILSFFSPSHETPLKSLPSGAATNTSDISAPQEQTSRPRRGSATETLKRVCTLSSDKPKAEETSRWPSLEGWKMAVSPPQSDTGSPGTPPEAKSVTKMSSLAVEKKEELRAMASSPNLFAMRTDMPITHKQHRAVASASFTPKQVKSSASLLGGDVEIAQIDPSLAAAELASALTKHVCCSVCATKGVNFPECRKCGMRFCSRDCRVGEQGAGDGKRHLCGVWKSRVNRAKENAAAYQGGGDMSSIAESFGKTPTASVVRAW